LGAKKFGVKKLTLLESLGAPPEEPEEQPDRLENFLNHILEINFNQNKDQNFKTFSSEQEARETLIKRNPGLSQVGAERMTRYALAYNGQTNNHKFKFNPALRGPSPVRFSENYWHALCSRVECPVTYFRAEHGFMPNSGKYAQRFEKFKQAKQINLPNMGHNIHVEDSFMERFVQELT